MTCIGRRRPSLATGVERFVRFLAWHRHAD
jgi:hypothetical protein